MMTTTMKRKRSANFSLDEKMKFVRILEEEGQCIITKVTSHDATTNKLKEHAWRKIADTFNACSNAVRTTDTLKKLWQKLKSDAKTYQGRARYIGGTGGGPSKHYEDPVLELVVKITGRGSTGVLNVQDCDADTSFEDPDIANISISDNESKVEVPEKPVEIPEHKIIIIETESADGNSNSFIPETPIRSVTTGTPNLKRRQPTLDPDNERSAVIKTRAKLNNKYASERFSVEQEKKNLIILQKEQMISIHKAKMENENLKKRILEALLNKVKSEPAIRSRYARLIVLMPPEPPKILQGSVLNTLEEMKVDLECVSVGGKPPAEITWVDHDGGVLTQGVTYTVEPMTDGKRFTARSILHLRLQRHHHNQTFTCQAQNTADRAYRSATIKIQVQYAPKVRVFVKSGINRRIVQEGETVILGCQANANPSNISFKWYINNELVVGEDTNELIITNVSRRYNEATVKCEVHNIVGSGASTKNLEVAYGPVFKTRPHDVEGEAGSTATLSCVVDGYPPPKILWLRYENERVMRVGKSSNLTLTITDKTAGQYWCRASIDHYQDIEAAAMVYVRSPPKIISNGTQFGVEGDIVRVECISFSIPKPDYIIWTFAGGEINTFHNQDYAFLEETLADRLTKSTLIIRKSEARHFGKYNCTVANSYGIDSIEINLVANKSLPLVLIISASASIITLILVIMLIVMLCHRKTTKEDEKKPDITDIGKTCVDQFRDSDRSSNISDLKLELRQVEGSCDMDNSNAGSETDLHPTLHLTSNLGLPLAGPVPLPESGYDNELMKQYQRYSGDFNQPINNIHFKAHSQSNGYVPYVDYSRDYAPPLPSDSLTGSLSRSTDGSVYNHGCMSRQASCGRLAGVIGPDVIPMPNPAGAVDVRYAATYGNPYLRGSGPITYVQQVSGNPSAKPPPYARNPASVTTSATSPSSSSSSRPVTSPMPSSSSTNSGAQPQVPKLSPQSSALYILPPNSRSSTNLQSTQITAKGNGSQLKNGTHV